MLLQIPKVFKIKGATLKEIKQSQVRTAFFGGVNHRDEPFEIDGIEFDYEIKEHQKLCRHVKLSFLTFLKQLENLDLLDENKFQDFIKNKIVYKYKEFAAFFKTHIGKNNSNDSTEALIRKALSNFIRLMKANHDLLVFEMGIRNDQDGRESLPQQKSLIQDFAQSLQACFQVLKSGYHCPDPYQILKNATFIESQLSPLESYFQVPLRSKLDKLRVCLEKQFSQGQNYWKLPLTQNEVFIENLEIVLDQNKLCEQLLGNDLQKQYSHFLYKICSELNSDLRLQGALLQLDRDFLDQGLIPIMILEQRELILEAINYRSINQKDKIIISPKRDVDFRLSVINKGVNSLQLQDIYPKGRTLKFTQRDIKGDHLIELDETNINFL